MNIINRLHPFLLKSGCLFEHNAGIRSLSRLPGALGRGSAHCSGELLASCRRRLRAPSCSGPCYSQRLFSEMCEGSNKSEGMRGGLLEESDLAESDPRDKSSKPGKGGSPVFDLDVLVSLLRQENAEDICVIKVPEHVKYTQHFIVVSGVSPRHLRAMGLYAIKVYKFLKKDFDPHVRLEGKDADDWMCVDFGNMVVHFMLPETRELYELEKLWTLRRYDEQLRSIPDETLPDDFIYDLQDIK